MTVHVLKLTHMVWINYADLGLRGQPSELYEVAEMVVIEPQIFSWPPELWEWLLRMMTKNVEKGYSSRGVSQDIQSGTWEVIQFEEDDDG